MTKHRQSSLAGAIRAYADEERDALDDDRPSAELAEAYFLDQLDDDDRRRIRRRIALDPDFADEIVDRQSEVMRSQKQEDWQALAARAEAEGLSLEASEPDGEAGTSPAPSPIVGAPRVATRRWVYALAAGWILTVIGAAIWIYRLETAETSGSVSLASRGVTLETHVLSMTLRPNESRRSTGGPEPTLRVDATTERVTLFLLSADVRSYTSYSVELRDPLGSMIAKNRDLRRAEDGSFTVSLDPTSLSAGRYELVVLGRDAGEPQVLGKYPFHVEPAIDG